MFSEVDIITRAWMTIEVVNLVLSKEGLSVDKIFLIGSYANGNADFRSDIDFLVQLSGSRRPGLHYPTWKEVQDIHRRISPRVHVIFGREEVQQSLLKKRGKKYREIPKELNSSSKLLN